ncbi:MAG: amidohydrolase family protein [Acidobacteria bacterium]|nr:amidohydrolase family protein [Acidobacteriota bacterium]
MTHRFASLLLLFATGCVAAEPADWILSARWVVTMDPARRIIDNGAVAVRGPKIVVVGPRADIEQQFQVKNKLHRAEAAIMPGLVNTHTHAAMSLYRGVADDMALQEWLEKFIFPAEARNTTADFVRWGTRLALLEMLLSGTTMFCDMYYF